MFCTISPLVQLINYVLTSLPSLPDSVISRVETGLLFLCSSEVPKSYHELLLLKSGSFRKSCSKFLSSHVLDKHFVNKTTMVHRQRKKLNS
jgi:hypothetical protein